MADKLSRASLSKGRSGWCVIFRHPVAKTADQREKLRVRRGLGTRDEAEAQALVDQLNQILLDPEMWSPAARDRAAATLPPQVVGAFYDYLTPEPTDAWAAREAVIPLPDASKGYARVLMVGTTGAGKTTIVRQLLGTDPDTERFPSTSAAKTTICDIEIVLGTSDFRAVVAFMPKDRVRQYIADCVSTSASRHIQRAGRSEVTRRFLEHTDQQFRLSYVLGTATAIAASDNEDLTDDDADASPAAQDEPLISSEERAAINAKVDAFIDRVETLADSISGEIEERIGSKVAELTTKDMDAFEELVEEELLGHDEFHSLVDEILDDVESRFDFLPPETLERGRDGWPRIWQWSCTDRIAFIREVNRFSSNYAPNFGRLLTPLVEGIRVVGPFGPTWRFPKMPKIVIMDGRGIGHTADSTSSVSTSITRRFEIADAILLADNAAQPMQAAPCAVLRSLAASGHESKLLMCFTHFDEVKGDNLLDLGAKKSHVLGSVDNAINAVGKVLGRDAEHSLRRLLPDRAVFLANIQKKLPEEKARFTTAELRRLVTLIEASTTQPEPLALKPIYDVANLVLAIQRATQEFHDVWRGVLGMGTRSGVSPEHWTRVKALTRRLGLLHEDEYDNLRPVADLIRVLQTSIAQYLATPMTWVGGEAGGEDNEERIRSVDAIKKQVFTRLHDLSTRRLLEERLSGWREAYEHRGTGSTRVRARDLVSLYESAAPVPNEMPARDANEFLFEIRELVGESIIAGGGEVRGWTRQDDPLEAP